MYFTIIAVIMSVFSSPTRSPGCPDLDQTYPMSLSDDLREDEQGVQHEHESHHISIDTSPQVHHFRYDSEPDSIVYASFNLQNINAPVPPKWKHNDHILEEYKKFHHSCQRIFNGLMAHITSDKVKTNMSLIWYGPDGEDIYDNFELEEDEMYGIDHIMEQSESYCKPICNFCAARYKF